MANPETTVSSPVAKIAAQDVCASDPNFALIFAFWERFGESCGVIIPTFQELQEMLEKTNEVPDALIDLHIKLLRRVRKSVHIDKWEKAILKFCQVYSIPEFWELEHYGYKGISIQLKLRILKTLFEAQFDSNVKFKAEINKLESSTLRSQPLGWDKSGVAYWVQFDRAYNLRVYKEDIDEDIWKIVANDRNTLVNLINELSGAKDNTLDDIDDSNSIETSSEAEIELSPGLDQEKYSPASPNTASTIENNKIEYNINESNIESESKTVDSKENVLENSINLKTQFDEDDGSKNKINNAIVGETIEESVMIVKGEGSGQECDTGNPDEINTQNETSKNEDVKKPKLWSIDTICSSSKEVREENISVPTTGFFFGDDSVPCFNNVSNGESSCPDKKLEVNQSKGRDAELNKIKKLDEVDSTTTSPKQLNEVEILKTSHNDKSLNKECTKNEEEFPTKNTLKQSVFNIKVHEEEVQITERNANEAFPKSDPNIKNDNHKQNVYESTLVDTHDKPHELNSTINIFENNDDNDCNETSKCGTDNNIQQNKITDECEKISINEDSNITLDKQIVEQKDSNIKLEDETEQLKENDQLTIKIVDQAIEIDKHVFDDKLQNIEQSTSEVNRSDKIEKIDDICEKDKTIESPTNTVNQCADINDQQNIDAVEQNLSSNKTILDMVDLNVTTDNQITTDTSNVIDKGATVNSVFEDSKINVVVSDNISKHIETTDEPEINIINSNYSLNQHTESDNSTLNIIDCSSKSKVHDQTVVEDIDQSFKTYKQDGNQNSKINKKTLHNIRNIIETDMTVISDNDKESEQLTSAIGNKIKQLEHFKIKNENNFINIQEENKSVVNVDCQMVPSNKHSLDNIFKKSDEIKEEISECPKFEKETTEECKLKNKPEPCIVVEIDNIGTEKSEINIKELKNIDISNDLIEVKKEVNIIENEIKTKDIVLSEPKQKEFIDMIDETGYNVNDDGKKNDDDEPPTISVKQCSEDELKPEFLGMSYMDMKPITKEIKLNNKKEKHKSINSGNKTNICFDEKLKLKESKTMYDKEDTVQDLVISESTLTVDEENSDETLKDGKNVMDKLTKNEEKEVDADTDINQKLKIKDIENENIQNPDEENILKTPEEQFIISPIHGDVYETNEETFIESPEEEFNDSEMIDPAVEKDTKKSDIEEIEETPKKKGKPGRKKGKRGKAKKISTVKQKSNTEEKIKRPYKPRQKKVVTIAEEVIVFPEPAIEENIRRSRRIAEIKIKEQCIPTIQYDDIDEPIKILKKKDRGKKVTTSIKKMAITEESDEEEDDSISKKSKKNKRKGKSDSMKKLNIKNPWNVDSESSNSEKDIFEDYDHEEEDEILRPGIELNVSDHEFSPESDINDEDEEYLPEKRARTAHKKDHGEQLKDDMSCRNCNKSDQPEWILLCDTCNEGWHASCLRPPLMVIPDGDWYCPTCHHNSLLNALKDVLKKYDGESKKRENEELRRKRLAYVGISLQNVITSKTEEVKTVKQPVVNESSDEDEEQSESDSYDSEPLYQLRARRQANVSYRFNEYDDMINEAILETGDDEFAVEKSAEIKTDKNDDDDKTDSDENDKSNSPIAPALLHLRGRKKSKKLTNLDVSSDDGSDEDFKGPSDGDDDYEEDFSEYSDDSVKRPQPTRRSGRNRKTVVDPDFINDDSSEDSDQRSKKKRSRPWSDSSNSEEEDFTWGKKKKKRSNAPSTSSFSFKQPTESKRKRSQNDSFRKPKKSKIKYGTDSDSDGQPRRRTRGRQITYAESDDSEEEVTAKKRKTASDEEDEYVLNDEELEIENEDHNFEGDDDDTVASNEEKDVDDEGEDDDDEGEGEGEEKAAVDGNEEEVDDDDDDDEQDDPRPPATDVVVQRKAAVNVAPPPSAAAAVVRTVIKGPPTIAAAPVANVTATVDAASRNVVHHRRPLPPTAASPDDKQTPPYLSVDPATADGKRKRPAANQPKRSPPNASAADYAYPYAAGAATNAIPVVPPPPPPAVSIHDAYNRRPPPPPSVAMSSAVGLRMLPAAADVPTGVATGGSPYPATYHRAAGNKIAAGRTLSAPTIVPPPPAYQLSPHVQQVVYDHQPAVNYSAYHPPVDYAPPGALPPPSTIAFRNVVVAPPPPPQQQQQQSISAVMTSAGGGDSEFGGLVSYFSSQQEDDFDA